MGLPMSPAFRVQPFYAIQ